VCRVRELGERSSNRGVEGACLVANRRRPVLVEILFEEVARIAGLGAFQVASCCLVPNALPQVEPRLCVFEEPVEVDVHVRRLQAHCVADRRDEVIGGLDYLGIYDEPRTRHAGLYTPAHFDGTVLRSFAATDILYLPFSYTLTIDEPEGLPTREGEITHLASLGYDEQADVEVRLAYNTPLMPSNIGSPDKTA
jgi:hypothetical protein